MECLSAPPQSPDVLLQSLLIVLSAVRDHFDAVFLGMSIFYMQAKNAAQKVSV